MTPSEEIALSLHFFYKSIGNNSVTNRKYGLTESFKDFVLFSFLVLPTVIFLSYVTGRAVNLFATLTLTLATLTSETIDYDRNTACSIKFFP